MLAAMSTRPVFLHIGASKTGTSALQRGLFDSAPELADQGVGLPLGSRDEHIRSVLRPLGWVTASGFVRDPDPDGLAALETLLRETPGDRLLMTCEDLCELDPERIRLLVDALGRSGHEVHVVLTLRGLASVVPSEYQQFLKHRMTLDYPTFLERVRDQKGRWAKHFWQRQHVARILERWTEAVGDDHLDVIVTPDRAADPDGLYRMFGEVVGVDTTTLTWPERNVNASWGYVEAEVYRRVNAALGDRLGRYEKDYQPGLRWPLVQGVLPRSASARITLPPEHLTWVTEATEEGFEFLKAHEVRVHGDLASLMPAEADAAPLPDLDEAAVARAAVETLANLAVFTLERQRRSRRKAGGGSGDDGPRRTARRLLRRG